MLRIGTGIAKGRRLRTVTGTTRPTGSRVRGSLFDTLSVRIVDSAVLDLCAGSGSLGIEALSRGARCCVFVDNDRRVVRMIRDNLDRCGFGGRVPCDRDGSHGQGRVWMTDAVRSLSHLADHACKVDIILADPPYGDPVAGVIIRTVGEAGILVPGGLLVLEHRGDDPPETCAGLDLVRRRDIGDTALSFFEPARPASQARSARSAESARSESTAQPVRLDQAVPAATGNRPDILPTDLPPPSSRTRR